MSDSQIPHYHNSAGHPVIKVKAHAFMCIGALPPFDHPHIFMELGASHEHVCPYCSTLYVYDPMLEGASSPAGCLFADGSAVAEQPQV